MKKILLAILLSFALNGCGLLVEPMPKTWKWGAAPRPLSGVRGFPPADTDYGEGFKDGCAAAWDAVSKGLLADINHKKMNAAKLATNDDYGGGWGDGFEQCTYIIDWNVV